MSLTIQVKVKPNATEQTIQEISENNFIVSLKSAPKDGKANQELIKFLAKRFNVPKSHISIKSGLSSRHKLIRITT